MERPFWKVTVSPSQQPVEKRLETSMFSFGTQVALTFPSCLEPRTGPGG